MVTPAAETRPRRGRGVAARAKGSRADRPRSAPEGVASPPAANLASSTSAASHNATRCGRPGATRAAQGQSLAARAGGPESCVGPALPPPPILVPRSTADLAQDAPRRSGLRRTGARAKSPGAGRAGARGRLEGGGQGRRGKGGQQRWLEGESSELDGWPADGVDSPGQGTCIGGGDGGLARRRPVQQVCATPRRRDAATHAPDGGPYWAPKGPARTRAQQQVPGTRQHLRVLGHGAGMHVSCGRRRVLPTYACAQKQAHAKEESVDRGGEGQSRAFAAHRVGYYSLGWRSWDGSLHGRARPRRPLTATARPSHARTHRTRPCTAGTPRASARRPANPSAFARPRQPCALAARPASRVQPLARTKPPGDRDGHPVRIAPQTSRARSTGRKSRGERARHGVGRGRPAAGRPPPRQRAWAELTLPGP